MAFIHLAMDGDRIAKKSVPGNSSYYSKSVELLCGDRREPIKTINTVERRTRSSSMLGQLPRSALNSKWENTLSRLQNGRRRAVEQISHGRLDRIREETGMSQPDGITFWDHYTGHEYQNKSPISIWTDDDLLSCTSCLEDKMQLHDRVPFRDPGSHLPPETSMKNKCLLCHRPRNHEDGRASVKERGTRKATISKAAWISDRSQKQQQQLQQQPQQQQPPPGPAVCYLTFEPPDPAASKPNVAYGPFVLLVPFLSPNWFNSHTACPSPCSGLAGSPVQDSSNCKCKEEKSQSYHRVPGQHQHLTMNINDLDLLYRSLCQAVKAAKRVQLVTKDMSQSLISDMNRIRALRECLSTFSFRKL